MKNLNFSFKALVVLLCFILISNVLLFTFVNQSQAFALCAPIAYAVCDTAVSAIFNIADIFDLISTVVSAVQLVANLTGADWLADVAQQFQTIVNFAQVLNFDKDIGFNFFLDIFK